MVLFYGSDYVGIDSNIIEAAYKFLLISYENSNDMELWDCVEFNYVDND